MEFPKKCHSRTTELSEKNAKHLHLSISNSSERGSWNSFYTHIIAHATRGPGEKVKEFMGPNRVTGKKRVLPLNNLYIYNSYNGSSFPPDLQQHFTKGTKLASNK